MSTRAWSHPWRVQISIAGGFESYPRKVLAWTRIFQPRFRYVASGIHHHSHANFDLAGDRSPRAGRHLRRRAFDNLIRCGRLRSAWLCATRGRGYWRRLVRQALDSRSLAGLLRRHLRLRRWRRRCLWRRCSRRSCRGLSLVRLSLVRLSFGPAHSTGAAAPSGKIITAMAAASTSKYGPFAGFF